MRPPFLFDPFFFAGARKEIMMPFTLLDKVKAPG